MPNSIEYEVIQILHVEIIKLAAQRDACLAVCRAYVDECEDTFIDPCEMTDESKQIYVDAQAAITLCD